MSYMSYCRYEGTLYEFRRCKADIEEHVNEEAQYPVSQNEIKCFRTMVHEFFNMLDALGLLDYEDCDIDEEALDEVCFAMEKGYEVEED